MDNSTDVPVSNTTNSSITANLVVLNSQEALKRLPVIVFIAVMILVGTVGNLHVIYIYFKFFNRSTYRNFVLTLAAIDIVSCVISMPFEIYDELNPYLFHAEAACKVFRFINFTLAIGTGFMLVVIASERYRRICKPFGNQLTEKQSMYAMVVVIACASGVSLPSLYIYGRRSIDIPGYATIGTECTWGDHVKGSVIGYIFYGVTLLIILLCMIALIAIYVLVGKYLWKHARTMATNVRKKYQIKEVVRLESIEEESPESVRRAQESFRRARESLRREKHSVENGVSSKTTDIKTEGNKENNQDKINILSDTSKSKDASPNHSTKATSPLVPVTRTSPLAVPKAITPLRVSPKTTTRMVHRPNNMKGLQKAFKNVTGRKAGVNPLLPQPEKNVPEREKKITIVLFTITVLFILSFLPYIIILILYSVDEGYEASMTQTQHTIYLIGLRLYLINNVSNPFLYSSFDSKFRKHLTDIYSLLKALF